MAYRAGVRATRDAVAKKYGAASSAMAALDRAFPEAAREDDDDLLEGGDDPLTEEERDVAGRDGYREGLKTVNDALGTSYSVAEVITRGYGAGGIAARAHDGRARRVDRRGRPRRQRARRVRAAFEHANG